MVTIEMRDRRKAARERRQVCKAGLISLQLPVQRLVVILPSQEAWGEGFLQGKPEQEAGVAGVSLSQENKNIS